MTDQHKASHSTSGLTLVAGLTTCLAAVFLTAVPAHANHADASYCPEGTSVAETLACHREGLADEDARLNELYSDIIRVLGAEDERRLVEAQRSWIVFRDKFCAAEEAAYSSQPNSAAVGFACQAALTTQQIEILNTGYWDKVAETKARLILSGSERSVAIPSEDPVRAELLAELIRDSSPDTSIAVKRVPGTKVLVSYKRGPSTCGSGGCRPEVWRVIEGRPVSLGKLTVGFLPLVWFGTTTNGLPDLGLGSKNSTLAGFEYPVVLSQFNGQEYVPAGSDLPEGSGTPLISHDDLVPVR